MKKKKKLAFGYKTRFSDNQIQMLSPNFSYLGHLSWETPQTSQKVPKLKG